MMFVTKKALSRREALRGMGAMVALPFLDAMVPALTPLARTAAAAAAVQHALRRQLDRRAARLQSLLAQLGDLSPLNVLERGYALAYGPDGRLLRDAGRVQPGDEVAVRLARGRLTAEVKKREQ